MCVAVVCAAGMIGGKSRTRAGAPPPRDAAHFGLAVAPAESLGGVVVTDIDPSGTAAERGFEIGDVIVDIGNVAMRKAPDVPKALADAHERGSRFAIARVKSGDAMRFIAIPLS